MKKVYIIIVLAFIQSCTAQKTKSDLVKNLVGVYKNKDTGKKLELHQDGSFVLYNAPVEFTPVIEQCEYSSKGKWSQLSADVFEITSEDYYLQQNGFKYDLKKENKFSQDSLYINVKFPNDFHPVKLNFYFNSDNNKSIHTESTVIKLLKSKHLFPKSTYSVNRNHIKFSLDVNVSGTNLYKGRILFNIFEEDIDTEKTNYLTIILPNFDQCFYEFEPYKQENIFIKESGELLWQGYIWKKL